MRGGNPRRLYLYVTQRSISRGVGGLPYIKMPVRNILPDAHITAATDAASNRNDAMIWSTDNSGSAAIRKIIIIGVNRGINDRTTDAGALGCAAM